MRVLIQRVSEACVFVRGENIAKINRGLLVLTGVEDADNKEDLDWLAKKILNLRIFADDEGKMNLCVNDIRGDILIVSQFTLHAKTKKGNRPSFIKAAAPDHAQKIYQKFIKQIQKNAFGKVACGEFGADMQIKLCNDGPVSIWIDSKNRE